MGNQTERDRWAFPFEVHTVSVKNRYKHTPIGRQSPQHLSSKKAKEQIINSNCVFSRPLFIQQAPPSAACVLGNMNMNMEGYHSWCHTAGICVAGGVDKQSWRGPFPIRPEAKCLISFQSAVSPGKVINFPDLSLQMMPTFWWLLGKLFKMLDTKYILEYIIERKYAKKNVDWFYYNMDKERNISVAWRWGQRGWGIPKEVGDACCEAGSRSSSGGSQKSIQELRNRSGSVLQNLLNGSCWSIRR